MNYPYDDENMIYDYSRHRYVLTEAAVERELGINLALELNPAGDVAPQTLPQRWLKQISNTIYNYIYQRGMNNRAQEYLLAKYPPLREIIYQAMLSQVLYSANNGFFQNYSGVNLVKGQAMDLATLRDRVISPDAKAELETMLPIGICIVYAGNISLPCRTWREDY